MSKIAVFFADGCEEIEGLTVIDLLRRAGLEADMVSITGRKQIEGSHGIAFLADVLIGDADLGQYDGVVLPGGMPGTLHLGEEERVTRTVREFAAEGKLVCAICAAPSVLGQVGVLQGRRATCHPGFEDKLTGATVEELPVVVDGNLITSRGMGTVIDFSLAIIGYFTDMDTVSEIKKGIVVQ